MGKPPIPGYNHLLPHVAEILTEGETTGPILERRKDAEKRIAGKIYTALRRAKPSERQSVLAKLRGEWENDTSHLLQKDADKVRQKLRKGLKKKYPELKF